MDAIAEFEQHLESLPTPALVKAMEQLSNLEVEADAVLAATVAQARVRGLRWRVIGVATGMHENSAYARWRNVTPETAGPTGNRKTRSPRSGRSLDL